MLPRDALSSFGLECWGWAVEGSDIKIVSPLSVYQGHLKMLPRDALPSFGLECLGWAVEGSNG